MELKEVISSVSIIQKKHGPQVVSSSDHSVSRKSSTSRGAWGMEHRCRVLTKSVEKYLGKFAGGRNDLLIKAVKC